MWINLKHSPSHRDRPRQPPRQRYFLRGLLVRGGTFSSSCTPVRGPASTPIKQWGRWIFDPVTLFTTHKVKLSEEKTNTKHKARRRDLKPPCMKIVGEIRLDEQDSRTFEIASGMGQGVTVPFEEVIKDLLDRTSFESGTLIRCDLLGTVRSKSRTKIAMHQGMKGSKFSARPW